MTHDPDAMTGRARAYLILNALGFGTIGWFCIAHSEQFQAAAYIPIVNALDVRWWGVLFALGGIVSASGAWTRSPGWARAGLVMSAGVLGGCSAGLWIGIIAVWIAGKPATPISTIIMTLVVGFNLIMCSQPMRTPFEQVLARFVPRV